jgi:hypothetical protein
MWATFRSVSTTVSGSQPYLDRARRRSTPLVVEASGDGLAGPGARGVESEDAAHHVRLRLDRLEGAGFPAREYAAGLDIALTAGASASTLQGEAVPILPDRTQRTKFVVAATPDLHAHLLGVLGEAGMPGASHRRIG